MGDKTKGIHLFSNGSEFEYWTDRNCAGCIVKIDTCPLIGRMFNDSIKYGLPSGNVTQKTAERLGYTDEYVGRIGWPCKARKTCRDPRSESSLAQRDMRRTGADGLPGFDAATHGPAPLLRGTAVELPGFETVPVAETSGEKTWTA